MRATRRRAVAALSVAAVAVLGACSSFTPFAAEVNGTRITQDDLNLELEAIRSNPDYLERVESQFASQAGSATLGQGEDTFTSTFVAAVLNRQINFELIHQEIVRRNIQISDDDRRATENDLKDEYGAEVFAKFPAKYRQHLIRTFSEFVALEKALGSSAVGEDDIRRFYEENREAFDQTCVRHILVADQAKAASLKVRIDGGEDFAAIARAESTDNQEPGGTAQKGGDLGCVTAGSFVPEFDAAMAALQPGQVSDPVQTQFGFHLIEVTERKTQSLEDAAEQILEVLQQEAPNPVAAFVAEAMEKADIEVNPRYGTFVNSGPELGVRPPDRLDQPATTQVDPLQAPEEQ